MTTQIGLLNNNRKVTRLPKVTFVSPATGVKSDLEKLLTKFTETNSVRYEEFAELWREMQMSLIFAGRQRDADCREFLEDSFRIAVEFLLAPYNFQVRVGALYILYALYVKQPCTPLVQVRLLPNEFSELLQFLEEVQQQRHLDVEYVYHFLMYHRVFTVTATALPMYPVMKELSSEDPQITAKQDMLLEQKSILSEIMESDNIDQLSAIHEQYHRTKCLLSGGRSQPKTSLNVIKASLVQYITKSVAVHEEKRKNIIGKKTRKRHDSGQTTTSESEPDSDLESTEGNREEGSRGAGQRSRHEGDRATSGDRVGERRAAIKARAFAGVEKASKSRRHRQAVTESSQTEDSFSPASPVLSPPGRKRKAAAAQPKQQKHADDDENFSQLSDHLRESLLSMPSLSEFQDGPSSPKRKHTGASGKQKPQKSGKKERRLPKNCNSKSNSKRNSKSKSLKAVKLEKSSESDTTVARPSHSKRKSTSPGKGMPRIVMKQAKESHEKQNRRKAPKTKKKCASSAVK